MLPAGCGIGFTTEAQRHGDLLLSAFSAMKHSAFEGCGFTTERTEDTGNDAILCASVVIKPMGSR